MRRVPLPITYLTILANGVFLSTSKHAYPRSNALAPPASPSMIRLDDVCRLLIPPSGYLSCGITQQWSVFARCFVALAVTPEKVGQITEMLTCCIPCSSDQTDFTRRAVRTSAIHVRVRLHLRGGLLPDNAFQGIYRMLPFWRTTMTVRKDGLRCGSYVSPSAYSVLLGFRHAVPGLVYKFHAPKLELGRHFPMLLAVHREPKQWH